MEKLQYQKPYIKKLHAGVMNKFGTRAGVQPVKSIEGVAVTSLIEQYGSPVFVLSEKQIRKNYRSAYTRLQHPLS
jgi:diaminopimelate decarboxylase